LGTGFLTRGGAVVVRREGLMIMEGSGVVVKAVPSLGCAEEGGIAACCSLCLVVVGWGRVEMNRGICMMK
jgi:hypothetical protein